MSLGELYDSTMGPEVFLIGGREFDDIYFASFLQKLLEIVVIPWEVKIRLTITNINTCSLWSSWLLVLK